MAWNMFVYTALSVRLVMFVATNSMTHGVRFTGKRAVWPQHTRSQCRNTILIGLVWEIIVSHFIFDIWQASTYYSLVHVSVFSSEKKRIKIYLLCPLQARGYQPKSTSFALTLTCAHIFRNESNVSTIDSLFYPVYGVFRVSVVKLWSKLSKITKWKSPWLYDVMFFNPEKQKIISGSTAPTCPVP